MRHTLVLSAAVAALACFTTGCSAPAYKLGRGWNNMTEVFRGGDMRRSIEQTSLFHGADSAYTFGAMQGISRTVARTVLGAVEVVTFPFPTPTYDPIYKTSPTPQEDVYIAGPLRSDQFFSLKFMTQDPQYPSNYKPGPFADSVIATDTTLGFSGGDIIPMAPGSRFFIFNY
jgi:putative exosortase-associated protein (TIGR04073 family)